MCLIVMKVYPKEVSVNVFSGSGRSREVRENSFARTEVCIEFQRIVCGITRSLKKCSLVSGVLLGLELRYTRDL